MTTRKGHEGYTARHKIGGVSAYLCYLKAGLASIALIGVGGCNIASTDDAANDQAASEPAQEVPAPAANEAAPPPPVAPIGNEAEPIDALAVVMARVIAEPRVPPLDTCRKTGSFPEFRKRFETAVAERDFALLEPLIDYDIETDFGGGEGMKNFADSWRGSSWETSKLWDQLDAIVALGCGGNAGGGYYAMPRMFVVDLGDVDPFAARVALGEAVPLRARPSQGADVIALLDWTVVTAVTPQGGESDASRWTEVTAADGTKGFVKSDQLRSPIDYRAVFQPRKGGWKMTAFIAGY